MLIKRNIVGIVCVMLFCMIHTAVRAQDFRVNSAVLSSANTRYSAVSSSYSNDYMQSGNRSEYTAISHAMPSMSRPSTCSTILGSTDSNEQDGSSNTSYRPNHIRRVSEDDHNADPFMPVGNIPWILMLILSLGYFCFKLITRTRARNARVH